VTERRQLVLKKIEHLKRMTGYLAWSLDQVRTFIPIQDWAALTAEQHESLAAFRIRFSEFQEHIGKAMRAVAIEEEENHEPFGAVLAFMEKLGILDSTAHWKLIRELRNAVNHEYEDNPARLSEFFRLLVEETPTLIGYEQRLTTYCYRHYSE
jgi:hypothetical protein